MSRTARHNRKMENIALIAQLLGGLGQGIAGAKSFGQKNALEKRKLDIAQQEADTKDEEVSVQRRHVQAQATQNFLERILQNRREGRLDEDSKSRRSLEAAQARHYDTAGGSGATASQRSDLAGMLDELGIDPSDPAAPDKIHKALVDVTGQIDQLSNNSGSLGDMAKAQTMIPQLSKRRDQLRRAVGTLRAFGGSQGSTPPAANDMSATTGAYGPPAPQRGAPPGHTASDMQGMGDILNMYGHVMGGIQRGIDASAPLFDPIWHSVGQMFPHLVPDAVRMRSQGVDPSTGMTGGGQ